MAYNQMAGGAPSSHADWLQFESLIRYNLPQLASEVLYREPSPAARSEQQQREEVQSYLSTISRVLKQCDDLRDRLDAKEAELQRYKDTTDPAKDGLLLKVEAQGARPEELAALKRGLETARLKAQTNEETIINLERMLKRYKERIRFLENQAREKSPAQDNLGFWPLRYRDNSLDLNPLLAQAKEHDQQLASLVHISDATVKALAGRMSPVAEDIAKRIEELEQEQATLRTEAVTHKSYTPQEAAEKISICLTNSAAKEALLRQYESLKTDLLARWFDYQLAAIFLGQKEELCESIANARIVASERTPAHSDITALDNIDKVGTQIGQSEAHLLDRCATLQDQLLALSKVHHSILTSSKSPFPSPWELERLTASQEKSANLAEENLDLLLEISGKPKDSLNALKSRRTKVKSERTGPTLPSHAVALSDVQGALEQAMKDAAVQAKSKVQELAEKQTQATHRLRMALEESEHTIMTLADLATRDPAPLRTLATERESAKTIDELLAVEEKHQKIREQLLKDVPHVLIRTGSIRDVFEAVKGLRTDLKEKLRTAKQFPALDDLAKADPIESEAAAAFDSLSHPSSPDCKEKTLYAIHDHILALLAMHKEVQGAGFIEVDNKPREELTQHWKRMVETIGELVELLADAFHKLTIDDPETKAELEAILETQSHLLPAEPRFPAGFEFSLEVIAAIKRMLSDTNNLTDVIAAIKGVDENLLRFEQIMQENYYKLKPVVGAEEVPGRRGGRKTTFLHITHAEPTNPKEGMNILMEIISTLKKNTDNLFEIESKRVQVVENSLNIKRASDGLQLLKEIEQEEKRLRSEDVQSLKDSPGSATEVVSAMDLSTVSLDSLEQIPNYSESITAFLRLVMPWLQKSLDFDRALNVLIKKLGAAAPPVAPPAEAQLSEELTEAIRSANNDLEEVYEENSEITEALLRLVEDPIIEKRFEDLRAEHLAIVNEHQEWTDPQRLFQMVVLFSKWMPPEKKLALKVKPSEEDPDVEPGKRGAGLKSGRTKVKSGKPGGAQNPFEPVRRQQDKLMTDLATLLGQNQAPEELAKNLTVAVPVFSEEQPFESLMTRQAAMDAGIAYLMAYLPNHMQELLGKVAALESEMKAKPAAQAVSPAAAKELADLQNELRRKQAAFDALQKEAKEQQSELAKKQAAVDALQKEAKALQSDQAKKQAALDALQREAKELQSDQAKKQAALDALQKESKELKEFKQAKDSERPIDLNPLLEEVRGLDNLLSSLVQASDTTIDALAAKVNPLPTDVSGKVSELKQAKTRLPAEPQRAKPSTPQEALERVLATLRNSAAKNDLLCQMEVFKKDLSTRVTATVNFDQLRALHDKILTDLSGLLEENRAPEEITEKVAAAVEVFRPEQPVESLMEKGSAVEEAVEYLMSYIPQRIDELETLIEKETVITVENERTHQILIQTQSDMSKKQKILDMLNEELKELKEFKAQCENKDEKIFALDRQLKTNNKEWEEAKKRLSTLETDYKRVSAEKTALERTMSVSISKDSEMKALLDMKIALESSIKDREAQYKAATENLQTLIKDREAEIDTLKQQLAEASEQGNTYLEKYKMQLKKRIMTSLSTTLKFEKAASVLSWKLKTLKKYSAGAIIPEISWTFISPILDPSPSSDRQAANDFLCAYSRFSVEEGPLHHQFEATDGRREKPMGLSVALELMAEVLRMKATSDSENLSAGKRPPPFPDFLIDYLTVKQGTRAEAAIICNKLLLALLRMYKQRHGLATFYVRLLRMYHYAPLPYALSISALQLMGAFRPLAEACEKVKTERNLQPADWNQTGGEAFLVPVMELILNLFEGQPLASRLILQGLITDNESKCEYSKLKLALGLRRTGATIAKLIPTPASKPQFSATISSALEMLFSPQEAEWLFDEIAKGKTVTKEVVEKAMRTISLEEASTSDKWVVPMSAYLLALADAYHYLVRDHLHNVQTLLNSFGWKAVTLADFNQLVAAADIHVPAAVTESWFDEARGTQTTLTPESATRLLIKFPINLRLPLVPAELSTAVLVVTLAEVVTSSKKIVTTTTVVTKKMVAGKKGKK